MNLLAHEAPTVYVVAGDRPLGRSIQAALKSHHVKLEMHGSAKAFFEACDPKQSGCLVWDTAVGGPDDRQLLRWLAENKIHLPVILVSESADVATVVRAMKAGAQNYLAKPIDGEAVWEAVCEATAWDRENRVHLCRVTRICRRLGQLTPGEYDVLELLLDGGSNRQIADALGVSVRTIEVRRAKLMKKMKARSLPELVRLVIVAEDGR
jgi:FixJ family two-component response regulator